MNIPVNYIIEVGLCRKRNICALCSRKMDVPRHHIQLCTRCRMYELDKFAKKGESE